MSVAEAPTPRVDGDRLLRRLDELATIGAIEGTRGCSRLALTDADRAGRDLVVAWMRELGLEVAVDAVGNVVATQPWPDDTAPVLMGSHIDTVATGGRYDGNLGVLAGLEVIETVLTAGLALDRPLAVAFFTDEEGARFPPDMLGSLAYVGGMTVEEAHAVTDRDGIRFGDELARIGYLGPEPCPGRPPHAYVELHIEQGPVLEETGHRIGAVTGVQGISWREFTVTGQSNHAGTTPMHLRHDAGHVAARVAVAVRHLALELGGAQVATVGRLDLHPDLVNVVAGRAVFTVDLRNTDEEVLARAEERLDAIVAAEAAAEGVEVDSRPLARFAPVEFDPRVVDLVEEVARARGHDPLRLPSGAGHDAQMLARVCPTGMIFVPSHRGISHNPAEHTDPDDLVAGADVLAGTVAALAAGALEARSETDPEAGEAP